MPVAQAENVAYLAAGRGACKAASVQLVTPRRRMIVVRCCLTVALPMPREWAIALFEAPPLASAKICCCRAIDRLKRILNLLVASDNRTSVG